MRAMRIHAFGGPEAIQADDIPVPEPGPGEARVRVEAAGVNFIDIYQRSGQYRGALPLTLGQEAAGVVDAVGAGPHTVQPGDRVVYAPRQGAYAEYAIVPAAQLVPVPAGIDSRVAAAAMEQGLTAHYLSHSTFPIQAGQTVLVHAAAGGVGRLLVQMAKRRGARVLATVSTADKARLARAAGADEVILYTETDFATETQRLTGGRGVDVVYDSVGKTTFDGSLNCLRPRGMLVLFGQSSGAVPPLDPTVLNAKGSVFLTRPSLAHYLQNHDEVKWRAGELFDARSEERRVG